ncbi:MAG: N-formylglutamate amidohydrolase [Clostridiales bacterium]|nr:N-formylglutamate amidohydrolase [Clostridiales bacterium]
MFFMKPESGKQFSEVILHVPHSSTYIPEEFADSFLCDLETEMTLMSDLYTDILFDCRHEAVVFPVSRLICDVERFRDDCDEPMSRVGMGAVYTRAHTGAPLRRTGEGERERILRRWYDPHHAELERQVGRRLDAFGKCLVIDCHSFSGVPLPHEPDKDPDRPDICVGTDGFHTPGRLADAAADRIKRLGYSVRLNSPFAGSLVPLRFYRRDKRVSSLMLEINRSLYLDGRTPKSGFGRLKTDIADIIESVAGAVSVSPSKTIRSE